MTRGNHLLNENTAHFIGSRNNISNYQKISILMSTELWIPRKDHLKDVHAIYLNYKTKFGIKHWLNELRMVYNASLKLDLDSSLYDSVFIKLYFKTYPMTYTDLVIMYNWFFDILEHIYSQQKSSATDFSTDVFFQEMFREDLDNCSKHLYLTNEKVLVTINMVKGKEMLLNCFVKKFETLVVDSKNFCVLTLAHYYLCFKSYLLTSNSFIFSDTDAKQIRGNNFYRMGSIWLSKMLRVVDKACRTNFSHIYNLFVPYLNDYFVIIPANSDLQQFHVQYKSLEETVDSNILLNMENLSIIDLLVHSPNIHQHTKYLETLNIFLLIISKTDTSTNLIEEIKFFYYKFTNLKKLKSSSDVMLKNSIENYNEVNRNFDIVVFQQWLIQKLSIIVEENMNLLPVFNHTFNASDGMCHHIVEKCFWNNLPNVADTKELVKSLMDAHCETHNYLLRLLNFFLCFIEYKNIAVEFSPVENVSEVKVAVDLDYSAKIEYKDDLIKLSEDEVAVDLDYFAKIEYKDDLIKLSEDDLIVWNMLFEQKDLQLKRLNTWLFKLVKNKHQLCDKKFQIPLVIANLYLNYLDENKNRLSTYIILQIHLGLKTALDGSKTSFHESLDNLGRITGDFMEKITAEKKIIGPQNEQLVRNIINYIHCFLGLRKFHVDQVRSEYYVSQNKTFETESSKKSSEMSRTPVEITLPSEAYVIQTEAIIEYKTPDNSRKRPILNGAQQGGSLKQKKSRPNVINLDDTITIEDETPTRNSGPYTVQLDNDIHETRVLSSNTKVSIFEDQFKRKLNNLTTVYSDLIDVTGVKIKQENVATKTNPVGKNPVSFDSGNVSNNDSSDESDVIVLGPAPPKQYDVITLNEAGDVIQEKCADSGQESKTESKDIIEDKEKEDRMGDQSEQQPQANITSTTVQQQHQASNSSTTVEEVEEEQRSLCTYPKKWTREMIKFYTEDVNPDQFRQKILTQINRTRPDQWRTDYHNSYRFADIQFNYNKMCDNCASRQHDMKNCPKPCFSVCPMCGESGHAPDKCSQSCCLNCGRSTNEYLFNCEECDQKVVLKIKCDICTHLYHSSDHCPQLWRSMEFTTRKGKLKVIPSGKDSTNTKYCSNCAKQGHLIEECSHLSADHPLKQDRSWKVLTKAHTAYLRQYKLRVMGQVSRILLSKPGMEILQKLSNQSGVHIEYIVDDGVNLLTYQANPVQSHFIRRQLKNFLFPS